MAAGRHLFRVGLGAELRQLREIKRISTRSVAHALGRSPAWVSRTETGERQPTSDEVAALCQLYGASTELSQQLATKARDCAGTVTLLASNDDYAGQQTNLTVLENQAAHITVFELALVPGLLQTAEYAHHIIGTVDRSEGEMERRVSARLGRQVVLVRHNAPSVTFFLDESVLHRVIGSRAAMRRQLSRILADAQLENVRLRVVPANTGAYPGLDGPFTLFEFSALDPYLYLENRVGGLFLTSTEETREYADLCSSMSKVALDEVASAALIGEVAGRLADG